MATLDILTEAEAQRAALNADVAGHESEIARMNTAISGRIDELCGPVVNRAVTEYHDGTGIYRIIPRESPVSSVTTLKEWDGNSTVTTLTEDTWGVAGNADGFYLSQSTSYAHACWIERRSSGSRTLFASGPAGNVELVYVGGRAATTADVPAKFKQVVASILSAAWDRDAARWARGDDPFDTNGAMSRGFYDAVTRRVQELLRDELKVSGIA